MTQRSEPTTPIHAPPANPAPESSSPELQELAARLQVGMRRLQDTFLGKEELVRLLFVSMIAGEHVVMIGPPGTAKSAMARAFAKVIDASYFDYLLTRFTEPNEVFGPVDIKAFREGNYRRRIDGMLPTTEIAFLDEIFKANSAILNSLLSLLNSRRFTHGNHTVQVPLISLIAASNEVPNDEALSALFDRFLLRVRVDYLESYHFRGLIQKGAALESASISNLGAQSPSNDAGEQGPVVSSTELLALRAHFAKMLTCMNEEFLATYKSLVFQIRSEGIGISDRRLVKLLKLFAASAILDGRSQVNDSDLFVMRHIWNTPEQQEILHELVGPVLDRWYEQNPEHARVGATPASLSDLLAELSVIRETLANAELLSDMQLFAQLRNLNDIRAALLRVPGNPTATRMVSEVDQIVDSMLASQRFG